MTAIVRAADAVAPVAIPDLDPILNISIFAIFVVATLVIVIRASRNNKSAADYYAAGRSFTGPQNGFAIAGDYLSAASFLGIAGAIAVAGYDGFLYSIGFLVAWLVALLLVAELMRNLDASHWLETPVLIDVKAGPVHTGGNERLFQMTVRSRHAPAGGVL